MKSGLESSASVFKTRAFRSPGSIAFDSETDTGTYGRAREPLLLGRPLSVRDLRYTRLSELLLFSPNLPHGACQDVRGVGARGSGKEIVGGARGMRAPRTSKSRAGRLATAMGHFKTTQNTAICRFSANPVLRSLPEPGLYFF
jgi:hypothetical protein